MNRQRRDIDEELGAALRARARTGDGDLLWQIMRNVDALPQARRGRWADGLRLTPSISYVILLALLGAAIVGALAVASITRPDPLPASFENGVIVVSDGGIAAMRAIEPATGEAVPAEELDLPEGAGAAWAVDGSRYAYVHEHQIMVRGIHALHIGAEGAPERGEPLHRGAIAAVRRREDAPAVDEQFGKPGVRPRILGARHRMRGNEVNARRNVGDHVAHD